MPYSIPGSTKFRMYILWQQHYFFILVGTICVCEFAMVPGVYILLCPQEEKVHSSSYTFSFTIIKNIKNPLCDYIIMARSLLNWKTTQATEKD